MSSEFQDALNKHVEFVQDKYGYVFISTSVVFFVFTFAASATPSFAGTGVILLGIASIASVVSAALVITARSRTWRLGLQRILERRSSNLVQVDVPSLVTVISREISKDLEKQVRDLVKSSTSQLKQENAQTREQK